MTREEFRALGLKPGDKVRVKIEGEFEVASDGYVNFGSSYLNGPRVEFLGDRITIEKVAEPFKPGDVLRSKEVRRNFFLLGETGYQILAEAGAHMPYYGHPIEALFSADRFERVTVP